METVEREDGDGLNNKPEKHAKADKFIPSAKKGRLHDIHDKIYYYWD